MIGGHHVTRTWLAGVTAGLLLATPALAQTAPDVHGATSGESASLTHSAMKATTFKIGSTITNVAVLSYAAGDLAAGTGLAAFFLGASWLLYTTNDYLWDTYSPPPVKQTQDQAFDATADVWRNTGKFFTYKPVIASVKLATLYAYTGSGVVAGVFGTATVLINTGVFYANNMAWDWYDWYSRAPQPVVTANR
jgi:uncharacterized membrane protein